jgi:AcrR family transcriptional regulator
LYQIYNMGTKESIINIADDLIRGQGFNAFSFKDISNTIGIKTASIHYHFPTKSDLGVAILKKHIEQFEALKLSVASKSPMVKLERFLSIYSKMKSEGKICLIGSLISDLNTIDENIKTELGVLTKKLLAWITEILEEGKRKAIFHFKVAPRAKALMILTNIVAIVQLSRLTNDDDFTIVKNTIIKELKP